MYISKIVLTKRAVFKDVFVTGYSLHQEVWDLFADNPGRDRDFIYRLDYSGKLPLVYTVSNRNPNDRKGIWHIESKEYMPIIRNGARMGFTVRISPTVKREGKRHDVVMDLKFNMQKTQQISEKSMQDIISDSCRKWIDARAEKNGFNIIDCRCDDYRQVTFDKKKDGVNVRYSTVDITGVIEVIDHTSFIKLLFKGIGPEKGFGCGLIMVRKL